MLQQIIEKLKPQVSRQWARDTRKVPSKHEKAPNRSRRNVFFFQPLAGNLRQDDTGKRTGSLMVTQRKRLPKRRPTCRFQKKKKKKEFCQTTVTPWSRSATGPLLRLSCCTRPCLAHTGMVCYIPATSMPPPEPREMTKVKRFLRYPEGLAVSIGLNIQRRRKKKRRGSNRVRWRVSWSYAQGVFYCTTGGVAHSAGGPTDCCQSVKQRGVAGSILWRWSM